MNRKHHLVLIVTVVVVLLAAASALALRSQDATAQAPVPGGPALQGDSRTASSSLGSIPGGPGFLMVNPFQFRPHSPGQGWSYSSADLYNEGSGGAEFDAALTLPNNVTITQLTCYFYDNSADYLDVFLFRCDPATGVCDVMAADQTSGAEDQYRTWASTNLYYAKIDQQHYSYVLAVYFSGAGGSLRLSGVRIDYTSGKVNLPLVTNNY